MPGRPSSSRSRPFSAVGTSDGARPTTSFTYDGSSVVYEDDEEEYTDEDESSVEDLFAFLPPTTADAEAAAANQNETPAHIDLAEAARQPDYSQVFTIAVPQEPMAALTPPPRAFDPSQRYFPESPTSAIPLVVPPVSADEKATPLAPVPPKPVTYDSPPSTGSHGPTQPDTYRMRKLKSATSEAPGTHQSRASGVSSREVRVSLHPPGDSIMEDYEDQSSWKHRGSSTAGSYATHMSDSNIDDTPDGSVKMGFDFDTMEEDDSPYAEVRASVSNIDDPDMPALTLRMWIVGLGLVIIAGGVNVFFTLRFPAPTVVPMALLLLAYPVGKFFAYALPIRTYRLPKWLGGVEFSLNPGPWNIKEHVLVYIMANVAVGPPYAILFIITNDISYGEESSFGISILLTLGTQMTGFGLAGLCRKFLVWPASMIWPQNLVACTLLNTLHAEDDDQRGGISKYKYFWIVFCGAFFWYFLPGMFFKALSIFSFACWIAPNNLVVNQLLGVETGLGMSLITFDWTNISYIGSPLIVPWWAELHIMFGFVVFYWFLVPILYYADVWDLSRFPMTGTSSYDRFGKVYNISRVVKDGVLDQEAYDAYSPLYLPATFVMTYILAFALSSCVLVHTMLYHGRTLWNGVRNLKTEPEDVHARLMKHYKEVPYYWYLFIMIFFFCCVVVAVEVGHEGVPVWMMLIALLLPVIYILPSGFIYAMTNQGITLNLQAEIIPGVILQGNPTANMIFKTYAVQTLLEATSFIQDLKLGHYIKVPPRATFFAQLIATCISSFVQIGVKQLLFSNVKDICSDTQAAHLVCPHNRAFYTASAVWGLIGPTRQFGPNTLYHPQLYAIAIGAVLPIPFWLWSRRYPKSWVKYLSIPVILNGVNYIPPAFGINYSSWFIVGYIFQYYIRRRYFAWWEKFNYVTSAALDIGTVVSVIFIFLVFQFPASGYVPAQLNWWGNNVFTNTLDHQASFRTLPYKPIMPDTPLPISF